jgi:hypothetical protein
VAEGIEDYETWSALTARGCPAIQGYLVAKPMPGAAMRDWAAKRPANRILTSSTASAPAAAIAEAGAPLARDDTTPARNLQRPWPPPPTSAPSPSGSLRTRARSPSRAR